MLSKKIPITLNGIDYDSITDFCAINSMSDATITSCVFRLKITHIEAILKHSRSKKFKTKDSFKNDILYKKWGRSCDFLQQQSYV